MHSINASKSPQSSQLSFGGNTDARDTMGCKVNVPRNLQVREAKSVTASKSEYGVGGGDILVYTSTGSLVNK